MASAITFLVERPHPSFREPVYAKRSDGYANSNDNYRSASAALRAKLPVELPVAPESRGDAYRCSCRCETVYRVTPEGVRWLDKHGLLKRGLSEDFRPVVCACMGSLVEN